ncbi:histidine kinase [Gordoniibacillus kamchatkensis]|uniref:Histidine kinase n=1 Tax=Gordoniibacillus kamchatkensis TaxID=1590651 RepID=A0ABR5AB32_9BACL|nr:sensor histidine kinase [Paenibacillus sp. VKM B-2647]KIL37908.1 histidine kinase [Paenibacillus sp. VKM B-2647]
MNRSWLSRLGRIARLLLMRDRPLVTKLLVFAALLVVVPMCFIGLLSYLRSAAVLENEARQYSWQIIEQVNTHVGYYVNDFEISILKIINDPVINAFTKMKSREELDQSGIQSTVKQVLRNAAYSRSDISNITVVLENIQTIDALTNNSSSPTNEPQKEYWYAAVPAGYEPKIFTRVIAIDDRKEQVISIARRLVSPMTLQPIGMIVIDVNFRRFQEIAEKVVIGRTGYLYILDSEGRYVYHPNLNDLGMPANFENLHEMLTGSDSGSFITSSGSKRLLTYARSSFLGWTLVTSIPYAEVIQGNEYIRRTIFNTVVITLAVAALFGIGFASSIIRPVKRLYVYTRRVEAGDFSGSIRVESKDEIGLLTHSFNRMVARLRSLLDEVYFSKLRETELALRQREIELKALQSQMNPHFMYNSLDTIRGMALEHSIDSISEIAASLARLLRYNLKSESQTVTLEEELFYAELYLRVQKYRFEHKLEYEFDIPEWAKTQQIAKFSLQPLVENSIVHGFEPAYGITRVSISAQRESEEAFVVQVRDTGIGLSEQRLAEIRSNLKVKDVIAGGPNIGIVNVHRRIQYLFGDAYGVTIDSAGEQGAVVRIRLPLTAS